MPPGKKEIAEDNQRMLRRWQEFQTAAEYIVSAFSPFPEVEKIVLFGSVAVPLKKEVPRFRNYRRSGIEILHECLDVDLAVWVNDLNGLNDLRKARSQAMNQLWHEKKIGVAHHQVEIFLMEPHTCRYLGRLCCFGSCPKKGKQDCFVSGCGDSAFLQQIEEFQLYSDALSPEKTKLLFDRNHKS